MDLKPTGGKNGRSGNESEKVSEWARQDFLLCVPLQERRSRESDFKLTESTCISYPLDEAKVHFPMGAVETVGKVKFAGASYLLDSGSHNRLWFLCCSCVLMNNLIQGYRIDGYGLLRETEKELAPAL